jgi:hypothetical protein
MAVFTDEQLKEIENIIERNAKKIAENVLKDSMFIAQVKKMTLDEVQNRLKS